MGAGAMYLQHFGLSEPPFRITPHTDFFFAGANRGPTLEALIYAITHEEGIVRVSGEVGSGKTMLCRMLVERLPPTVETVYIANPTLRPEEIIHALADEMGIGLATDRTTPLLRALQDRLIELHGQGRQVVVLIDEAHAMPIPTLEQVRLLSNLETQRAKLLQIVLFGQPEFDQMLEQSQMRQLKDRITHHFALEPLTRTDVAAYVEFRLRAAGYRGPNLFTDGAMRLLARSTGGLTRRINILADKSLLAAYAGNTYQVTEAHVRAAIRDAGMKHARSGAVAGLALGTGALAAAVLAAGAWWLSLRDGETPDPRRAASAPAIAEPATPQPATEPATPAAAVSHAEPEPAPPTVEQTPTAPPAAAPLPPLAPTAAVPVEKPTEAPAEAQSAQPKLPADTAKAEARETPPQAKPPEPTRAQAYGRQTRELISRNDAWLPGAADDHWFVQLLTAEASAADEVERYVSQAREKVANEDWLRAYRSDTGAAGRIGVIYGDFATRDEATMALKGLPPSLSSYGAYLRQVRRLRP